MQRKLVAYILACVSVSFLLSACTYLSPHSGRTIKVTIRSDSDVSPVVEALGTLHRNDIEIHTSKSAAATNPFFALVAGTLGMMMLTGFVLFLYKAFCQLLRVPPTL